MKLNELPKVTVQELFDEQKHVRGVLIKSRDFEKLVEKMEDFSDLIASEKVLRSKSQKYYSFEEVLARIERKKK